jgi:hypothetical protein
MGKGGGDRKRSSAGRLCRVFRRYDFKLPLSFQQKLNLSRKPMHCLLCVVAMPEQVIELLEVGELAPLVKSHHRGYSSFVRNAATLPCV